MNKKILLASALLLTAVYFWPKKQNDDSSNLHSKSQLQETHLSDKAASNAEPLRQKTEASQPETPGTDDGLSLDPSDKRWIASELNTLVAAGVIEENQKDQYQEVLIEEIKNNRETMQEELIEGDGNDEIE